MNKNIALVTGATSGLGYSAATQLAADGWSQIIVTGRTEMKANEAATKLAAETRHDGFNAFELDLNKPASVAAAAERMIDHGQRIDFLLLNAGMVSGNELVKTDDNVEVTFASSLIGHHQLVMSLLEAGALSPEVRIVIAGSEAARGDVPSFKFTDLAKLADAYFGGDRVRAAEALIRSTEPVKFKPGNAYADAKMFVAWWAQSLARRLPDGMAVYAVSPGSAPDTAAVRNANFFMRNILVPMMKLLPGMSASVDTAANRYLQAAEFGTDVSGEFFASAPKKMTGPIEAMKHDHFHDRTNQEAAWDAVVNVAEVGYPAVA